MFFFKKYKFALILVATIAVVGFFAHNFSLVDPGKLAQELRSFCNDPDKLSKNQTKEQCYYQQFEKVAKKNGHEYAFETLGLLQKLDTDAQGCHLIAHGIGTGTYEHNSSDWQGLINNINSGCSYGAMHGILEKYIESLPDKKLTKEIMPNLCGPDPRADCNHIIGHLALVETKGDVEEALPLCNVFEDKKQKEFCLTGVFMEYQTALNLIEHGYAPRLWLNWPARVPELEKMCRAQTGENAIACWKEIVHAALVKFHDDPKKIFDFCNSAQVAEGATECKYHAIGIMVVGKRFDFDNLKTMCSIPQKEANFKGECYVRLASSTLSTLPDEKDKVAAFCRGLDEKYQSGCLYQVFGVNRQVRTND